MILEALTTPKSQDPIFWFTIIAGLGLFLYGIYSISNVLKKLASKKLSRFINKVCTNRFLGLLTGAGFTAVIQSSSASSSLVIGLVRAGVMTFIQAAAVIIGANIGTTITSFIISIPFAEYVSALVFIGAMILLLISKRKWQNIGELCFSIGCIFFGLTIVGTNCKELAKEQWFIDVMMGLDKLPWLGLLVGAVFTMCLQSSSAVIGVVQTLYVASAATAPITLFGILPIVFGSNIGTTIDAVLASIGGSKESKKVAFFHVMFNISGALLFMAIIYICKPWLETINANSPVSPSLQVSFSHLIFNVGTSCIFLPLLGPISKLINIVFKDKGEKKAVKIDIKELDNKIIKQFPSQGIALAKDQVVSMFKYALEMFKTIGLFLQTQHPDDYKYASDIEVSIDSIDRQLNDYLMAADKGELTEYDMKTFTRVLKACKDIERIGDYGQNILDFYSPDVDKKPVLKDSKNYDLFVKINALAVEMLIETIEVFEKDDKANAIKIIQKRRDEINDLDKVINSYFEQVSSNNEVSNNYLDFVFVDIINSYQRVFSHCSNIAKLYATDKVYNFSKKEEDHFSKMKDRY